jgi:hypothetical protein
MRLPRYCSTRRSSLVEHWTDYAVRTCWGSHTIPTPRLVFAAAIFIRIQMQIHVLKTKVNLSSRAFSLANNEENNQNTKRERGRRVKIGPAARRGLLYRMQELV